MQVVNLIAGLYLKEPSIQFKLIPLFGCELLALHQRRHKRPFRTRRPIRNLPISLLTKGLIPRGSSCLSVMLALVSWSRITGSQHPMLIRLRPKIRHRRSGPQLMNFHLKVVYHSLPHYIHQIKFECVDLCL
jgi:hypothetical protein